MFPWVVSDFSLMDAIAMVARALEAAQVEKHEAVMVGDRHYDIVGSLANGVLPIGALWGYGSKEELAAAGCRHFAQMPDQLRELYVETDRGLLDAARPVTAAQ